MKLALPSSRSPCVYNTLFSKNMSILAEILANR